MIVRIGKLSKSYLVCGWGVGVVSTIPAVLMIVLTTKPRLEF